MVDDIVSQVILILHNIFGYEIKCYNILFVESIYIISFVKSPLILVNLNVVHPSKPDPNPSESLDKS